MSFDLQLANGDLVLTKGAIGLVHNKEKLIQDILKTLFTSVGENKNHVWYGTPLLNKVVANILNSEILSTEIDIAISYGLKNLQTLQGMQERDGQFVTPQEMLAKILSIEAQFDPADKRNLIVKVALRARSGDLITESFSVSP